MKLGAVYTSERVNAFYRMYLPMMAMHERGHEIVEVLQRRGTPLPVERLLDCDLVHIHRLLLTEDDDDCVARLREAGVVVGFDDDDDSEAAPQELVPRIVDQALLDRARESFARLLARAPQVGLVTTPSDALADRFEAAGARNVAVIDNYLPGAFSRVRPQGHDGLVVGWHAANEHLLDAEALGLDDVLRELLRVHLDLRVATVGLDLGLEHERYRREEGTPIAQLTQRLADFDVGIIPLADTAFNCARSNVKAREYAAAGVPWLASPVGSYAQLGEHEGGRLVPDDGWFDALDALIRSRRDRAKLAKRARKWAERETIWNMAGVWEQTFLDAVAAARAAA